VSARASTKRGWRRSEADPAKVGPILRMAGTIPSDGDPVDAWAHFDRQGRPRRIHARYADGWRATLSFRLDGTCSLSLALKLRIEGGR